MLENILLSAAYYESFSKFATSLKPNSRYTSEQMTNIAANALEDFYVSASDSGASEEEINALGDDLLIHVLAELDKNNTSDENDSDVKELENEIFNSLMENIDL